MNKIRISFDGFWKSFNEQENFIIKALKKSFEVEVVSLGIYDIDVIFYSIYATHYLEYDCVRIYYTGENCFPDFNLCDYAIGHEILNFPERYFRYSVALADFHKDYILMENRVIAKNSFNRQFCATVVSNCINADPMRDFFYNELSKYKIVDSGGRHLNNIGNPNGVPDKISFLNNYKFSLAFENVSHKGYCTEKIVQSFAAGTIPIYWGDSNVTQYFNEKSFINLNSFNSVVDCINYIKQVDNDNDLYLKILNENPLADVQYSYKQIDEDFSNWLCSIFKKNNSKILTGYGFEKNYSNNQKELINLLKYKEKLGIKRAKNLSFKKNFYKLLCFPIRILKYIFIKLPKKILKNK